MVLNVEQLITGLRMEKSKLNGKEKKKWQVELFGYPCAKSTQSELGSFGGQLHTQSHPIKGENPVVWYSLAELSELCT